MTYAVSLRYHNREYYTLLDCPGEVSFGTHKSDDVQIAGSADHLLRITARAGDDQVTVAGKKPMTFVQASVMLNEIAYLQSLPEDPGNGGGGPASSELYVSRVAGRSSRKVSLPFNGRITCGRSQSCDIVLTYPIVSGHHFQILCEQGKIHVEDTNSTNHLYLNGKRISKSVMKNGDVLSIYTFRFILENGTLYFENMGPALHIAPSLLTPVNLLDPVSVEQKETAGTVKEGFPKVLQYRLSPRIRETMPSETIVLSSPPASATAMGRQSMNWMYLLGSGAMMATSLASGAFNPFSLLYMLSPVGSIIASKKMTKEQKAQMEEYMKVREETYQTYIEGQKARIGKIADIQRQITLQENPGPEACIDTVMNLRRNLWERMPEDNDFLTLRLGLGRDRLCVNVRARSDPDGYEMPQDDDLEGLTAAIIEETRYVDHIPVRLPLRQCQTIGLLGRKEDEYYELRGMLVELTTAHSANDVKLVCLFREEAKKHWQQIRWLPHIWDESGQVRFIAFDRRRIHTVCELLEDIIRKRQPKTEETDSSRQVKPPLPHYVVVVDDPAILRNELIFDALTGNNPALGITTVFLAEDEYDLPQKCQYLVDLRSRPCVFAREEFDRRLYFEQDPPVHRPQMEQFSRRMAAVELKGSLSEAEVPAAVTFLQGYGVRTVEELNVRERWERSEPYRTLAAPLGVMKGGKIFSLDVRSGENSHGPHGLLAGTTGSGKSELLQSWILSMAVNYHPYDVNFVVIDYKGGGMSDLMEPLPHVVGKITNIDRNIGRSLVALKSELKRRQKLFAEAGVNNIDKYQRAYKSGLAKVRLPHLILVTDEFAELKKEEPDFMKELNSVATIGRSLGIHMLLATQKPAGVVNDQISANSRFRICMKVQDVADSREMLKRTDAARITQAGRAYIRVGEDELFELFQSFYSAAEYTGQTQHGIRGENQVKIVGVTGERIAPVRKAKKASGTVDELTAVIRYINQVCSKMGIRKMAGPWLPELPALIPLAGVLGKNVFDGIRWPEHEEVLRIPVGRFDIPAQQMQGTQFIDFTRTGHFAVYGSPGSGKTTFLKTVIMSLAMHHSPDEVKMEIIDAGNWSLSEFAGMPHVLQVTLNQEEKKMAAFMQRLKHEMEARRKAFLAHAVNSLKAYHETVSAALPALFIFIDQIGPLFDQYAELETLLTQVAGSGAPYGIHLMFTATSSMGIRFRFQQLIKGCITLQMADKADYSTLVGPVAGISLPNCPGRALFRGNPPVAFHTAMYARGEEEKDRHEEVLRTCEKMGEAWAALHQQPGMEENGAARAPQHDEGADQKSPSSEKDTASAGAPRTAEASVSRTQLTLGIRADDLEPVILDLSRHYLLLISAESGEACRDALGQIRARLALRSDNEMVDLTPENASGKLASIVNVLNDRMKNKKQHSREKDFSEPRWLEGVLNECILIEDLPALASALSLEDQKTLRRILLKSGGLGVVIIVTGVRKDLGTDAPDLATDAAIKAQQALILSGNLYDYHFLHVQEDDAGAGAQLFEGEMALIRDGSVLLLREA